MHFDRALHVAAYFSQDTVSPVVGMHLSTPLSFALTRGLNLVGIQSDQGPDGGWNYWPFGISMGL